MSVDLIVERLGEGAPCIAVEEWKLLVSSDPDLRLRQEPYVAVNPRTRERIEIKAGEADSEILSEGGGCHSSASAEVG